MARRPSFTPPTLPSKPGVKPPGITPPTIGKPPRRPSLSSLGGVAAAAAVVAGMIGAFSVFDSIGSAVCDMIGVEEGECSAGTGILAVLGLVLGILLLIVVIRFARRKRPQAAAAPAE